MAAYDELRTRFSKDDLRKRLEVAVCVKAHAILQEASPPTDRKSWATETLSSIQSTAKEAGRVLRYLLAANKDLDIEVIDDSTDTQLQTKTDEAIDKIFPSS